MTTKHTPGPNQAELCELQDWRRMFMGMDGKPLMPAAAYEEYYQTCRARDELLEACQKLLAITEPDEWAAYEPEEQAAFREARAAIALALGKDRT